MAIAARKRRRYCGERALRGTQVTVSLKYNPPAGKVGAWLATLTGDGLASKLAEDLRNFKRTMEAGEIPVAFREAT
jgi:uncharacterized membrane protein